MLYAELPFTPIKAVLEQGRSHGKYRLRCRVLCCLPAEAESFSHAVCSRCLHRFACSGDDGDEGRDCCERCGQSDSVAHDWAFALLLEDATGCLTASAAGREAAGLLGLSAEHLAVAGSRTRLSLLRLLDRLQDGQHLLDCWVAAAPQPGSLQQLTSPSSAQQTSVPSASASCFSPTQESIGLLSLGSADGDLDDAAQASLLTAAPSVSKRTADGGQGSRRSFHLIHTSLTL